MNTFNQGGFEFLHSMGGAGAALDALRRQAQMNRASQQQMHTRAENLKAQQEHAEIRWHINYIYGANARYFSKIRITDAKWSKV